MVSKKNVYLQMMVAYNYATIDEVKRFSSGQDTFIKAKSTKRTEEYNLEANLRHGRYMIARDNAMESEYVYVVPHYGSRPQHIHLQGQIFSRDEFENNVEYPNNPEGIGCINCRHEIRPYKNSSDLDFVPPDIDDPVFYENEQKMRAIERKVRGYKLEGNDDKVKEWYSKMMTFSETHNTPIQLNRTWIIDQDLSKVLKVTKDMDTDLYTIIKDRQKNGTWYSVALPKYNLSQVNLLPSVTNQAIDIGGDIKLASKYKGGFKQYLINGQNISQINMIPHNVRTSYTGRLYGFGKAIADEKSFTDMLQRRLEGKGTLSVHSHGSVKFDELTTELVLNASGVFYIPPNTAVSTYDPTEIYNNFKQYEVDSVTESSYGIYKDNNGVFKFFYGDNVPSDHLEIFDYSRVPNKQKLNKNLLNTPIIKQPKDLTVKIDRNRQKSGTIEFLFKSAKIDGVDSIPYKYHAKPLSEDEIIGRITGADKTDGSCVSQAYTYIANKYGNLDVLDFRGGESCEYFMWNSNDGQITNKWFKEKGVKFLKGTKRTSSANAWEIIKQMDKDTDYMLCCGKHYSIVRVDSNLGFQQLELQSDIGKWRDLRDYKYAVYDFWSDESDALEIMTDVEYKAWLESRKKTANNKAYKKMIDQRFGKCSYADKFDFAVKCSDIPIDDDFLEFMELINTNVNDMQRGDGGGIK